MPPFNFGTLGAGGGLLGVMRGMQQAKQRREEMEYKKALLKVEQDKIKIMEKETELTGQSKLQQAMAQMEEAKNKRYVVGKSLVTPSGTAAFTESPDFADLIKGYPAGTSVYKQPAPGSNELPKLLFTAPDTKGEADKTPTDIKIAERLVKESKLDMGKALLLVLGKDPESQIARIVTELEKNQALFPEGSPLRQPISKLREKAKEIVLGVEEEETKKKDPVGKFIDNLLKPPVE